MLFNSKYIDSFNSNYSDFVVFSLDHCRQLDLRMNQIKFDDSDLVLLNQLVNLTHLDLSNNNRLNELDLRLLNHLEQLNCSFDNMIRLVVNGHSLKQLNASHNSNKSIDFDFSKSFCIF